MAEVPKVVQERLRAASAGVAKHPDADVLAAFAERSLPGLEREKMLEHLSRCGECREVVCLALPASERAEVVIPFSRATWLTWPRMRWGFAAAGIVVVASVAIVLHRRQQSLAADKTPPPAAVSEARNQAVSAPSLEDTEKEQGKFKASPPTTGNQEREERSRAPSQLVRNLSVAPAPIPSYANRLPVAGSLAHGPKMGIQTNLSNQSQQTDANSFAPPILVSPAAPPAPASNRAVNGGSDAPVQTPAAAPVQAADDLAVQRQALSQPVPQGGSRESKVDRAKPLETVIVDNSQNYAMGAEPSASRVRSAVMGAAQWTISSTGGLQRSLDRGATWQDVNVDQSNAPGGASSAFAKAQPSGEKQQAALKNQKQASSEPVFHAVAANGPDVWAGGTNGMLFHSLDAGAHWTRIVPLSSGITLSGDIVTVDFTDPQHGRVSTSTSEIWITGDAGQSWQKR
jgi:Photosynthesis system II assembly factor YCF48